MPDPMTPTRHWSTALATLNACVDAVRWAETQPDYATAWAQCERGDWMLWLAGKFAGEPWSEARKPLVRAACACARLALPRYEARYPDDTRVRVCIETTERWTRGKATVEDVRQARASDAAAADAVYDAAAANAAYAAAYAAYAAAHAAAVYDAAAANAAYAAAKRAALEQCADLVRVEYPTPPEISHA